MTANTNHAARPGSTNPTGSSIQSCYLVQSDPIDLIFPALQASICTQARPLTIIQVPTPLINAAARACHGILTYRRAFCLLLPEMNASRSLLLALGRRTRIGTVDDSHRCSGAEMLDYLDYLGQRPQTHPGADSTSPLGQQRTNLTHGPGNDGAVPTSNQQASTSCVTP